MNKKEVPSKILELLDKKINQCVAIAKAKYERRGVKINVPKIIISNRLKSTGGLADFIPNPEHITINKWMLIHYGKKFIDWIIPHEYAHIITAITINPDIDHNEDWKEICIALGGTGERCHKFDNVPIRVNVNVYKCECKTYCLSNTQHKKYKRFKKLRVCDKCNNPITYRRTYAKRSRRNTNWHRFE